VQDKWSDDGPCHFIDMVSRRGASGRRYSTTAAPRRAVRETRTRSSESCWVPAQGQRKLRTRHALDRVYRLSPLFRAIVKRRAPEDSARHGVRKSLWSCPNAFRSAKVHEVPRKILIVAVILLAARGRPDADEVDSPTPPPESYRDASDSGAERSCTSPSNQDVLSACGRPPETERPSC